MPSKTAGIVQFASDGEISNAMLPVGTLPAAGRVFAITELLEQILCHLHQPLFLFRLLVTNRAFCDTIRGSSRLKCKMGLLHDPKWNYERLEALYMAQALEHGSISLQKGFSGSGIKDLCFSDGNLLETRSPISQACNVCGVGNLHAWSMAAPREFLEENRNARCAEGLHSGHLPRGILDGHCHLQIGHTGESHCGTVARRNGYNPGGKVRVLSRRQLCEIQPLA